MTKFFATRALMIVGLLIVGSMAASAQSSIARTRRVAVGAEQRQPVAVSAIALSAPSLNLTDAQRSQIAAIGGQAVALQNERARLWSEYNALVSRPDFTDEMAADEAAPRMLRIVTINTQLAALSSRQDSQINSILTTAQRAEATKLVAQTRASFARTGAPAAR